LGFVLEDIEPGLFGYQAPAHRWLWKVCQCRHSQGEQTKIVDEQGTSLPDCPDLLKSLLAFTSPATWHDSVNVLVQTVRIDARHGHGGTLLVVAGRDVTVARFHSSPVDLLSRAFIFQLAK